MEAIALWDEQLFLWLNGNGGTLIDRFMWFTSGKFSWIPVYLLLVGMLYRKLGITGLLWALLLIALCVTVNDQLASSVFKHWIQRLRPSHEEHLNGLIHLVNGPDGRTYYGGKFGFYSSHAANNAGVLTLFVLLMRPLKKWITALLVLWIVLIGYSRIYLGVHYPGDILMGFFMGSLVGILFFYLYQIIPMNSEKKI